MFQVWNNIWYIYDNNMYSNVKVIFVEVQTKPNKTQNMLLFGSLFGTKPLIFCKNKQFHSQAKSSLEIFVSFWCNIFHMTRIFFKCQKFEWRALEVKDKVQKKVMRIRSNVLVSNIKRKKKTNNRISQREPIGSLRKIQRLYKSVTYVWHIYWYYDCERYLREFAP